MMDEQQEVSIYYVNWKGACSKRTIIPHRVEFASTDWHPEPQWLLHAHDVGKNAERSFALKDIKLWEPQRKEPPR